MQRITGTYHEFEFVGKVCRDRLYDVNLDRFVYARPLAAYLRDSGRFHADGTLDLRHACKTDPYDPFVFMYLEGNPVRKTFEQWADWCVSQRCRYFGVAPFEAFEEVVFKGTPFTSGYFGGGSTVLITDAESDALQARGFVDEREDRPSMYFLVVGECGNVDKCVDLRKAHYPCTPFYSARHGFHRIENAAHVCFRRACSRWVSEDHYEYDGVQTHI